ncbi:MAG: hypothetical protein GW823_08610 [Bacteroidetes bacterium]|nr:hypothetical protein [Bacteroidota bacterium]
MNYKYLDITSKIALLILILFYVWVGFQWDENAPKKKRRMRSMPNTESVQSTDEKENNTPSIDKTSLLFRTDSYLSGLSGNVTLNGKRLNSDNLSISNGISFSKKSSTIETAENSWISIEFQDGFILLFPKSRVQLTDKVVDIKTGKVYFSGISQQAIVKSKGVSIFRGQSEGGGMYRQETYTEITVLSERNKVRVFCLNDEVTFKIFGKTTTLQKGKGASIFFDAKKINQYELGEAILPINDGPGTISWEPKNDPIHQYNVILRGINDSNPSSAEYVLKLIETQNTNITESQMNAIDKTLVFTENRYFTWSRSK